MPYLVKGKDTYTGQDVALLTKIDPEGNVIGRDDRDANKGNVKKSVSKNYYAKMRIGDSRVAFIGIHLLAQPLREDRRLQREAQSEVIRRLSLEIVGEGYDVIILGDFNDYDRDEASRDHIDSIPITNVLQIIRSMDTNNPSDDLINVTSYLPKASRYTAFYDANDNSKVDSPKKLTSIDHILISPGLKDKVDTAGIPDNHDPREVTDHFPVIVRFKLSDGSTVASPIKVRISSLLPNPEGNENLNEEISIMNYGTQSVDLKNWTVRNLSNKTWVLDELGMINPGEEKTIKRNGQGMSLNNNGDTIEFIDPSGKVVQIVTYTRVEEGELVKPVIE